MDPSSAQYQQYHQNLPSHVQQQQQQQPYYPPYHHNHQYNQPQQQYAYCPPQQQQHYPTTNAYHPNQQSHQDPPPIHPPGVPIQHDPNQRFGSTHFQNYPNSYYPQEPHHHHQQQQQQQQLVYSDPGVQGQQWQGNTGDTRLLQLYPQTGQTQSSGAGRTGGGPPFRGRGGGATFRGRGRGKGRIGNSSIVQPTSVEPPPCMAWCELCRVDCNTSEILENHKNGKKHKKNLKVQEELQAIIAQKNQEAAQMTNIDSKPVTETVSALPETVAVSDPPENGQIKAENGQPKVAEEQGRGTKRKAKSGRGGKVMRTNEGLKIPVEPPKPKVVVPFICELCNVKCESACVFDSHLKGKKHLFNLQRFQEQQATLGQAALQALYPALQALYPALLQAFSQPNPNASTSTANGGGLDQQVLQWLQVFLPQAGPGPGPSVLPQGPAIQGSTPGGGPQEGLAEGVENQKVEPESKTEELENQKVEPESKTEELENQKVEPESKTEELENQKVEPESKIEEPTEGAENQVEPESNIEEVDSKTTEERRE